MIMKQHIFFIGFGLLFLSACSKSDLTYEPSFNTAERIRVLEKIEQTRISTKMLYGGTLSVLSEYYKTHGDGVLDLTVSYDPKDHTKGAAWAAREAGSLKASLSDLGVKQVQTRILPVQNSPSTTFVRFASVHLLPPKDCDGEITPGLYTGQEHGREYKIGCGMKTLFAQQVSRKADLKGVSRLDPSGSARISAQLGVLNTNPEPQEFISTFALTEVDQDN